MRVIDRPDLRALSPIGECERLQDIINRIHLECEKHGGITPLYTRWDTIKRLAREGANGALRREAASASSSSDAGLAGQRKEANALD